MRDDRMGSDTGHRYNLMWPDTKELVMARDQVTGQLRPVRWPTMAGALEAARTLMQETGRQPVVKQAPHLEPEPYHVPFRDW